jgi:hypothetical protein
MLTYRNPAQQSQLKNELVGDEIFIVTYNNGDADVKQMII